MSMAKISKHDDAPEGDIKVSIGSTHFRVKDGEPYETDDLGVIETVESSFSDFLVVEHDEESEADPAGEAKALKELHKEQEKAKMQHATKDATEPAAPVPTSLADLEEIKADREEDKKADDSEGGKR